MIMISIIVLQNIIRKRIKQTKNIIITWIKIINIVITWNKIINIIITWIRIINILITWFV